MRRLLLTLVVLAALAAAPALAKTIHNARFQSPTKAIACGINIKLEGGGITCFAPYLPHTMLDGYVKLKPTGTPKKGERGDDPWLPSARHLELDCGHVPQIERPRRTHSAIRDFLQ